jgi:hypothetical protein
VNGLKPAVRSLDAVTLLLGFRQQFLSLCIWSTWASYLFDVVERMLRNVRHTRVGMLPHDALLGLHFARQQLDERALARAICLRSPRLGHQQSQSLLNIICLDTGWFTEHI